MSFNLFLLKIFFTLILDFFNISFLFKGFRIHLVLIANFFLNSFLNSTLLTIIVSARELIFLYR